MVFKYRFNAGSDIPFFENSYYETHFEFEINDLRDDDSKILGVLNMLVSSLSLIDGIKVSILFLSKGSIKAGLNVKSKDGKTNQVLKDLIQTATEMAIAIPTNGKVSHSGVKKTNAETKITIVKSDLLQKELDSKPTDFQTKLANNFDVERKRLENQKLEFENEKIYLENEKLRQDIVLRNLEIISKAAQAFAEGIIEADELYMMINGHAYLIKRNGKKIELIKNLNEIM